MPWDVGTRPEGVPLWQAAARDMKAIGADGINGDTFSGIPVEFRDAADAVGHPLALEPECQMQDQAMIAWNIMSWGYWDYQPMPVVSKYKWIESAAHGQRLRTLGDGPDRRAAIGLLQRRRIRKLGERLGRSGTN